MGCVLAVLEGGGGAVEVEEWWEVGDAVEVAETFYYNFFAWEVVLWIDLEGGIDVEGGAVMEFALTGRIMDHTVVVVGHGYGIFLDDLCYSCAFVYF
jgi:hypothetical protein